MAEYLIQDTTLTNIADAIRNKTPSLQTPLTQIDAADMAGYINDIIAEEYTIEVVVDDGAQVHVTNGVNNYYGYESDGRCVIKVHEPGNWVINAAADQESQKSGTVMIHNKYTVDLSTSSLNNSSWERIHAVSKAGLGENYWAVGDCKAVHLSGTMGTLGLDTTLYVYILGFNHNSDIEGNGIHFGGFKTGLGDSGIDVGLIDNNYADLMLSDGTHTFNMNHWGGYNYGGWSACDMRYDILGSTDVAPSNYGSKKTSASVGYNATTTCATNPVANTLMSCLPADLRAVMKPITKRTDNVGGSTEASDDYITSTIDYLPLLSEGEIFGPTSYSNWMESHHQMQYVYFVNGNSAIRYRPELTSSPVGWWTRSVAMQGSAMFCHVSSDGSAQCNNASLIWAICPVFMV